MATQRSTHVVVDLGFGDAGKGTIVDALARRCSSPPLVVRYNGGAQAGHNVVTRDGRHHTFSQFGSATFTSGSRTLLSQYMLMEPYGLLREYEHLRDSCGVKDAFSRLLIDERAVVITPYHAAMNRLREIARGDNKHGTCGIGVGEAASEAKLPDCIRVGDLRDRKVLIQKLKSIRARKQHQASELGLSDVVFTDLDSVINITNFFENASTWFNTCSARTASRLIRDAEHVIFEGAQGVLLDEWYGFHPHTTWSTTTTENALQMFEKSYREGDVTRIGVVRSYATRHGQGPFPTYSEHKTRKHREAHNHDTGPQGSFRAGYFDVPLTKYALSVSPVDALAMTHCDHISGGYCSSYEPMTELVGKRGDLDHQERLGRMLGSVRPRVVEVTQPALFPEQMASLLEVPLAVKSYGPTAEDKVWLR